MQKSTCYTRNPDLVFRRILDEMLLVPVRQKTLDMDCMFTLNPVGALIWEKIGEKTSVEALQKAVADKFPDMDKDETDTDVCQFLQQLEQAGAVRRYK